MPPMSKILDIDGRQTYPKLKAELKKRITDMAEKENKE